MGVDQYEFFHPDGTFKSKDERDAYRDAKQRAKELARAESKAAQKQNAPKRSPYEARIKELQRELPFASPAERASINRLLGMLEPKQAEWEEGQAQAAKAESFAKHDLCKLASEMTERIERSGTTLYPSATPAELDALVAIGKSLHDFPSPESAWECFSERLSAIESKESERASTDAMDKQQAAHKAEAEAARAQAAVLESRQRQAEIEGASND